MGFLVQIEQLGERALHSERELVQLDHAVQVSFVHTMLGTAAVEVGDQVELLTLG